ncbi:MAG: EscU/YscU/HrcU family type III secretion system export apparatus switch protein [Acidimicrobiales bacterium]
MAASDKHSRTEAPTPKRKGEARKEGRVARSPDVGGWVAILVATVVVPWLFSSTERRVLAVTGQARQVMSHPTVPGALAVVGPALLDVLTIVVPVALVFMAAGVLANIAQVGFGFATKAARPRLDRISPAAGVKRLASPNTVWEVVKQVLKLGILSGLGYQVFSDLTHHLAVASPVGLAPVLGFTASTLAGFVRSLAAVGLALGIADYAIQRHRLQTGLKMTKNEVKDERRQSEGDPAMRAQLRKRQYAIARSRMMAAVKTADVVVTNPTHFAVALRYESGGSSAPRVVAKGVDVVAARIRQEAATHRVPVVEDPPLSRYLFAVCEVGQPIPAEIYLVVARVLAFVYSLPASWRGVGVHRRPPSNLPPDLAAISSMRTGQQARARRLVEGEPAA